MATGQQYRRAALWTALLLLAVGPTFPRPSVENRTAHLIWVRPEAGVRPLPLPPAGRLGGIDALADPVRHPGRIFRACDYCSVIVDGDGRVRVLCSGLAANVCQVVRGGWKGGAWLRHQQLSVHDHDWDPIFARSTPGPIGPD